MMHTQAETIWAEIERSLKQDYQLRIDAVEPLSGGYLNLKWRISTPRGPFVVKQYNAQRYGTVKRLHEVEQALIRQMYFAHSGINCPEILTCSEHVMHTTRSGICFMVMSFLPGRLLDCTTVTPAAMAALGRELSKLHAASLKLPYNYEPLYGPSSIAQLRDSSHARLEEARHSTVPAFLRAALTRIPRLDALDDSMLQRLTRGYAHCDFAGDNVLFSPITRAEEPSAIIQASTAPLAAEAALDYNVAVLDFDRMRYGYFAEDIGRALMSFAFDETRIRAELVEAFMHGYSTYMEVAPTLAVDCIWFTWAIEYDWWVSEQTFLPSTSPKVQRFLREILFINEHGVSLDSSTAAKLPLL